MNLHLDELFNADRPELYDIHSTTSGPRGSLPLSDDMLRHWPSGHLFGLTQNVGMGWKPAELLGPEVLLLSTQGGMRAPDGSPIALGYHTGHWEVGLLMQAAAAQIKELGGVPFAGFCSDPCDGRSQGTTGMFDSLAYRNDAAIIFRRLIRSLPRRQGVLGIATCDKGLPAMMLALAAMHHLPTVLIPGGVTLLTENAEDAGKVQTIGARYAHGEISLEHAAEMGCRACGSPGGGCQFLGTAATSQLVGEALGLTLPHAALMPSGHPIWLDMASRSASALMQMIKAKQTTSDILTPDALHNAMVLHAAMGGSTNLILHIPAIAHSAKIPRPSVHDWSHINRQVPRLVDALPNGPMNHPTIRVFLAGGVPEVMLHLRELGLLKLAAPTVSGSTLGENLEAWEKSARREKLRKLLLDRDGIHPDDVIMSPQQARKKGLTSTVCFPIGSLAPEGSVVKSTSIDPSVVDEDGVYRKTGSARVFTSERAAIAAIKDHKIQSGDILVLAGRGPLGSGMEETYQLTSALKHLSFGKDIAIITDARFSGVSTGACIGHVSPEGLAGGPIGKLQNGDRISIIIDRNNLEGSLDLIATSDNPNQTLTPEQATSILNQRPINPELQPDPDLPDDTRLWAALQNASGGTWGGCVYDVDQIIDKLNSTH